MIPSLERVPEDYGVARCPREEAGDVGVTGSCYAKVEVSLMSNQPDAAPGITNEKLVEALERRTTPLDPKSRVDADVYPANAFGI